MSSISQKPTLFDPIIFLDTTGCDMSPSTKSTQVYRTAKEYQKEADTHCGSLKNRKIFRRPENAKNCLSDRLFCQAVNNKRKRKEDELCSSFFSTPEFPNSSKKRRVLPQKLALNKSSFVKQNEIIISLDNLINDVGEVLKTKQPEKYTQKKLENAIQEFSLQYQKISKKREQLGETGFESEWNPRISEILEFLTNCRYMLYKKNAKKNKYSTFK